MKKNILIIGSSGYLGKKLKKILNKKYNLITPNKQKLNIAKIDKIKKYFKNDIDFVINLSGQISNDKRLMKNIIVNGNKNIIKLCKNKKTKVFYLSTSLIYGFSNRKVIENSIKNPVDSYAKFKYLAERAYLKSKINFVILRLCNIYNGKKTGVVKNILNSIQKNKKMYLTNKNVYRNYIHINDATKIILKMLEKNLKHNIYNLGFENVKLMNLINCLESKLKIKIKYFDQNLNLKKIPSQKISLERIFNEIKYKPKHNIQNYIIKKFHEGFKFS